MKLLHFSIFENLNKYFEVVAFHAFAEQITTYSQDVCYLKTNS